MVECRIPARCRDMRGANALGLRIGLLGPGTGQDIVGRFTGTHAIEGRLVELQRCSSLQEQDVPILSQTQQVTKMLTGCFRHRRVLGGSMADFHYGSACVLVDQHFVTGFFEGGNRKGAGTCREIVDAFHIGWRIQCGSADLWIQSSIRETARMSGCEAIRSTTELSWKPSKRM